jgi:pyrroline-5-carboxylate reductase
MALFDDLTVGFIGFGNMAQAIADGLLRADAVDPARLCACAKHPDKLAQSCQARGMRALADARAVAEASDVVFVAVKPYLVEEVCAPVADALAGKVVVSVAAGMTFDRYEDILAPGTHHVSTIPNTPVAVNEGVWTCEARHSLDEGEFALVRDLLATTGRVVEMDSKLLGIAGTVTGCGPAFVAMVIEALGDAAVKYGVPRATAYELAAQMVAGAGKLAVETGQHPGALKDAVCSPGGTTIRGVAALEEHGLRNALIKAIDAIEG